MIAVETGDQLVAAITVCERLPGVKFSVYEQGRSERWGMGDEWWQPPPLPSAAESKVQQN